MKTDRSFKPEAWEVKGLRSECEGMSMQEAVHMLTKANYMKACQEATTVQQLAEILFRLIEEKF